MENPDECCVCLTEQKKWFNDAPCGHYWCRKCHRNMQKYDMTLCPLCRTSWWVRLPNFFMQALLEGYDPVGSIRWRVKRHRRRERRATYQNL